MKNKVLKAITTVVTITALVSACCLDTNSKAPALMLLICMIWFGLFTIANCKKLIEVGE